MPLLASLLIRQAFDIKRLSGFYVLFFHVSRPYPLKGLVSTAVGSALLDDPATHSLCSVNADKRAYSLGIAYMDAWISGPRTQACMHLPAH